MAAPKWPLTADRGATFSLSARVVDDAGTPRDLSGHTATFVRLARSVTDVVLDSHAATTDADGWVVVDVADETTATWDTGRQAYRIELEPTAGGDVEYLLVGPFTVRTPADV